MALSNKPASKVTEADLRTLRSDGEMESKVLDYKRDPVGSSDSDRKEFLGDVSSFANALGGHLVFGMAERNGSPADLVGLPGINPDREIARLEQMARDGIRPPIVGIETAAVNLTNGEIALVMSIPKSWNPPHQVTYQKTFRFYGRDSNGKYLLDVDELRSAFSLSSSATDRIKQFRADRVARIVAGDAPLTLEAGAKAVTHFMPLSAFAGTAMVDLAPLWRDPGPLVRVRGQGGSHRFNVDGMLFALPSGNSITGYVQVFRSGCIEVVDSYSAEANTGRFLPGPYFERETIRQLRGAREAFQAVGVGPPIVVAITLLGMTGWRILSDYGSGGTFDRDPLLVPEIVLDNFAGDAEDQLKPLLDMTWNAAGWPGSPFYDREGNRSKP